MAAAAPTAAVAGNCGTRSRNRTRSSNGVHCDDITRDSTGTRCHRDPTRCRFPLPECPLPSPLPDGRARSRCRNARCHLPARRPPAQSRCPYARGLLAAKSPAPATPSLPCRRRDARPPRLPNGDPCRRDGRSPRRPACDPGQQDSRLTCDCKPVPPTNWTCPPTAGRRYAANP
jgi:hypothetical protein